MNRSEARGPERWLANDLDALRNVTLRDLPRRHDTPGARAGRHALEIREGVSMKLFRWMHARPVFVTASSGMAVALVLLAVPIPYTRTIAHDVDLTLAGAPDPARTGKIAAEFGKALKIEGVSVSATAGAPGVTLSARVPGRSSWAVAAAARSFAEVLTEQGVAARESVRPLRERVSTNLFAYAAEQVREIRVNREGKSSEQVAEEIRRQLEAAGLRNASVEVTDDGETTQIMITGECDETTPNPCDTRIVLEGEPPPPNQATARIQCDASMTDAEKRVDIERQLREQGVEADVEVVNGKVTVHPRR